MMWPNVTKFSSYLYPQLYSTSPPSIKALLQVTVPLNCWQTRWPTHKPHLHIDQCTGYRNTPNKTSIMYTSWARIWTKNEYACLKMYHVPIYLHGFIDACCTRLHFEIYFGVCCSSQNINKHYGYLRAVNRHLEYEWEIMHTKLNP